MHIEQNDDFYMRDMLHPGILDVLLDQSDSDVIIGDQSAEKL